MDNSEKINTVIVEDNEYFRKGMETVLSFSEIVATIGSFPDVESLLAQPKVLQKVSVAILDIDLPGISGTNAIPLLLEINPAVSIIMVTVHEDNDSVFKSLENGAVGYLSKKFSSEELLSAISEAYRGGSPMSTHIARKVVSAFRKKHSSPQYDVSAREIEILQAISNGDTYQAIAADLELTVDGVRYHIRNIYRKMQVNCSSAAVAKAIDSGIIKIK